VAKHRQRSEWQVLVNNFSQSKDTMKNYCMQNNLNFRSFQNWCYKLKASDKQAILTKSIKPANTIKAKENKFIKLTLPKAEMITIKLPNGISLEFISNNVPALILKSYIGIKLGFVYGINVWKKAGLGSRRIKYILVMNSCVSY
jgi:hypothetical protein